MPDVKHAEMLEALHTLIAPEQLTEEAKFAFELCKWLAIKRLDDLLQKSILEFEEYLSQQYMEAVDDPMY